MPIPTMSHDSGDESLPHSSDDESLSDDGSSNFEISDDDKDGGALSFQCCLKHCIMGFDAGIQKKIRMANESRTTE